MKNCKPLGLTLRTGLLTLGVLLWATLSTPRPAQAQDFAVGTDPGTSVTLDLNRGRFLRPLPFDVQFFINGRLPEDVVGLAGRYTELTKLTPTCVIALQAADPPVPALIFSDAEGRKFEFSVPGLLPRKNYCFGFTLSYQLSNTAELRKVIADSLDVALQRVYRHEQELAPTTEYEAFRRSVIAAVDRAWQDKAQALGKTLQVVHPDDSFFNPASPVQRVSVRFRTLFDGILNAQANRFNASQDFTANATDLAEALRALRADGLFQQTVRQVRASSSSNAVIAARVAGIQPSLAMADLTDGQLSSTAFGLDPNQDLTQSGNLDRMWLATEFDSRIRVLSGLIQRLEGIRDLTQQLRENATLRGTIDMAARSAAEFATLTDAVNEARTSADSAREALRGLQGQLIARQQAIQTMAAEVTALLVNEVIAFGTTITDWETRAKSYISADVGIATAPAIDSMFFYMGVNFYLGPVNKRAPLSWQDGDNFRKRFAFVAAIPLNPFKPNTNSDLLQLDASAVSRNGITGVIGDRPLLVGAGFRINDLLRVGGGAVLVKAKDQDPLTTRKPIQATWYVSFSVDWDVKGMLGTLTGQTPATPAPIK